MGDITGAYTPSGDSGAGAPAKARRAEVAALAERLFVAAIAATYGGEHEVGTDGLAQPVMDPPSIDYCFGVAERFMAERDRREGVRDA